MLFEYVKLIFEKVSIDDFYGFYEINCMLISGFLGFIIREK